MPPRGRKPDTPEEIERKLLESVIPNTLAEQLAKKGGPWAFEGVIEPGEVLQFGNNHLVTRWARSRPLKGTAKNVLVALATRASQCGVMWPSRDELAFDVGRCDWTTKGAVRALEREGYIVTVQPNPCEGKVYLLACAVPAAIAARVAEAKGVAVLRVLSAPETQHPPQGKTQQGREEPPRGKPNRAQGKTQQGPGENPTGSGEKSQVRTYVGPPLPRVLPRELPIVPSELVATATPLLLETSRGEENPEDREATEETSPTLFAQTDEKPSKPKPATKVKCSQYPGWNEVWGAVRDLAGHGAVKPTEGERAKIGRWTRWCFEAGITSEAELRRRWDLDRAGNEKRTFQSFVTGRLTLAEYLPGAEEAPEPGQRERVAGSGEAGKFAALDQLNRAGVRLRRHGKLWEELIGAIDGPWWESDLESLFSEFARRTGQVYRVAVSA